VKIINIQRDEWEGFVVCIIVSDGLIINVTFTVNVSLYTIFE